MRKKILIISAIMGIMLCGCVDPNSKETETTEITTTCADIETTEVIPTNDETTEEIPTNEESESTEEIPTNDESIDTETTVEQ